jgi:hypothetical protein
VSPFEAKAPGIMRQLMADFGLSVDDAAAILGNIGHECAGFTLLQEQRPTVKGSRGGWGWCQWTGPRRTAAERYWSRHGYDPSSDTANYKWLFLELKGPEGRRALPALTHRLGQTGARRLSGHTSGHTVSHAEARLCGVAQVSVQ